MSLTRILMLLACALVLAACGDARQQAERRLQKIGAARLRLDAALLYKQMYSSPRKSDFNEVTVKNWPKTFQQFAPRHVGSYQDGFTLALHTNLKGESGIYVVPASMDYEPKPTAGTVFRKITEGVYWYSFD